MQLPAAPTNIKWTKVRLWITRSAYTAFASKKGFLDLLPMPYPKSGLAPTRSRRFRQARPGFE